MNVHHRIIVAYGRCRRNAPDFCVATFTMLYEVSPRKPRTHVIWTASAKLRNGRTFLRAINVSVGEDGSWCAQDEAGASGSRVAVSDITAFFANWLERVEDELGHLALRGLADAIASRFFHHTPQKDH